LHIWRISNTTSFVKTLTVRLSEPLVAEIEAESRVRKMSKSDVVRERLRGARGPGRGRRRIPIDGIADLIGSVDGLPSDLSTRKKAYLKSTRYGETRPR
jgi:ribbon-helix-helix CopG family protein